MLKYLIIICISASAETNDLTGLNFFGVGSLGGGVGSLEGGVGNLLADSHSPVFLLRRVPLGHRACLAFTGVVVLVFLHRWVAGLRRDPRGHAFLGEPVLFSHSPVFLLRRVPLGQRGGMEL